MGPLSADTVGKWTVVDAFLHFPVFTPCILSCISPFHVVVLAPIFSVTLLYFVHFLLTYMLEMGTEV